MRPQPSGPASCVGGSGIGERVYMQLLGRSPRQLTCLPIEFLTELVLEEDQFLVFPGHIFEKLNTISIL